MFLSRIMLKFLEDMLVKMHFPLQYFLQGLFPANFVHLKEVIIDKRG